MGLADDLENLEDLRRTGALTEDEFSIAKAELLGAGPSGTSSPGPRSRQSRNRALAGLLATVVLVIAGGVAALTLTGQDSERIEQRAEPDCEELSRELLEQNKPTAELYPMMRGLGCGEWLDQKLEEAGNQ